MIEHEFVEEELISISFVSMTVRYGKERKPIIDFLIGHNRVNEDSLCHLHILNICNRRCAVGVISTHGRILV